MSYTSDLSPSVQYTKLVHEWITNKSAWKMSPARYFRNHRYYFQTDGEDNRLVRKLEAYNMLFPYPVRAGRAPLI